MAAQYDGVNLVITLDAPTAEVLNQTVEQIYDDGKQWYLGGENSRFPFPWRTTGGDPLTPGVEAGAYFFLQNQDGWRIISTDEDQTINYSGNLVAEDNVLPIIAETPGRTVLHLGLQPVTQRVDELLLEVERASFNGNITINTTSGSAGTDYPLGTRSFPVDNLADARIIADRENFDEFEISGSITLDQEYVGFSWTGINSVGGHSLDFNNQDVSQGTFMNVDVSGTLPALTGEVELLDCVVGAVGNFVGKITNSRFEDNISFASGQTTIVKCNSSAPAAQVVIFDLQDTDAVVFIRGWDGFFQVSNIDHVDARFSVDMDSGQILFNASVINAATVSARGEGSITDDSVFGVDVDGLIEPVDIKEIHGDKGLDEVNAKTITENVAGESYDESVAGVTKEVRKVGAVTTITRQ